MSAMPKKAWFKPALIVLVRGRPEEAVLTACKTGTDVGPSGPETFWRYCQTTVTDQCDAPCGGSLAS